MDLNLVLYVSKKHGYMKIVTHHYINLKTIILYLKAQNAVNMED